MDRKTEEEKLAKHLRIKIRLNEHNKLKIICKEKDITMNQFVRNLINNELKKYK